MSRHMRACSSFERCGKTTRPTRSGEERDGVWGIGGAQATRKQNMPRAAEVLARQKMPPTPLQIAYGSLPLRLPHVLVVFYRPPAGTTGSAC